MKLFKLVITIIGIDILFLLVLKTIKENDDYEEINEDEDEYEGNLFF
ncbi:hypothetical protein ACWEXU_08170 [Staphylococcus xylosus]